MAVGQPFAFAGLWGAWFLPGKTEWIQSFTIITTDPNELVESIHTRMPVILHPRNYDRWLSRDATDQPPIDVLRPFEAVAMAAYLTGNTRQELLDEPMIAFTAMFITYLSLCDPLTETMFRSPKHSL